VHRPFYFRFTFAVCLLLLAVADVPMVAQDASTSSKLPLRATLVLTPEFCATRMSRGSLTTKFGFEVGKAACVEFEPALKEAFASITTTSEAPKTGDVQLILIPKFVDVGSTVDGITAFSDRELDVILQWAAKDISGTTIWIGTVQGAAKHHVGNLFTYKKNLKLIVNDAVKDLASQSAIKMSSSAELRKLSQ
jgi:hypothetical protein